MAITGKKVEFDSTMVLGDGTNGTVTEANLLDSSDNEANQGKIYFTGGSGEPKIIHNGKDYTGYHKPATGIPSSDLASAVQGQLAEGTAVYNELYHKMVTENWQGTPDNTHFPSEKLVKDSLDTKAPLASPALTGTPTAPTPSASDNSTKLATTAFVKNAISGITGALRYKGTLDGGSTSGYGALTPAGTVGDSYKVATAGKINGVAVEVGDMLICVDEAVAATSSNYTTIAGKWNVIQKNEDGNVSGPASSTDAHVAVFDGATGKAIKDSGFTIGKSVPSNAVFTDTNTQCTAEHYHYTPQADDHETLDATSGEIGDEFAVQKILRDSKGHVTGVVKKGFGGKEDKSNKVTALTGSSTDAQYPSAKCVYDQLATKAGLATAVAPATGVVGSDGLMSKEDKALLAALQAQLTWK